MGESAPFLMIDPSTPSDIRGARPAPAVVSADRLVAAAPPSEEQAPYLKSGPDTPADFAFRPTSKQGR